MAKKFREDNPRRNDSGPDGIFKMICRGPSMYPTLKLFDTLHVKPYNGRELLPGDVIVFTPPGACTPVAHRAISDDAGSIETRGDNNDLADPYSTAGGAVIGQVVYARTGKGLRRIYGGNLGRLVGRVMRMRRVILQWLCLLFRPIYHRAAQSGILRRLVPAGVKQSVVAFKSHGETVLQLYLGRVPVGKFIPELRAWRIRPPFRLFVNEELLPDSLRINEETPSTWHLNCPVSVQLGWDATQYCFTAEHAESAEKRSGRTAVRPDPQRSRRSLR